MSRQFSGDRFRIQRKEVKLAPPAPDSDEEAEIRINFQSALGEGWVAANMSGHWEVGKLKKTVSYCICGLELKVVNLKQHWSVQQ